MKITLSKGQLDPLLRGLQMLGSERMGLSAADAVLRNLAAVHAAHELAYAPVIKFEREHHLRLAEEHQQFLAAAGKQGPGETLIKHMELRKEVATTFDDLVELELTALPIAELSKCRISPQALEGLAPILDRAAPAPAAVNPEEPKLRMEK